MSGRPGCVRGARLTDLAAIGDLSRLSHPAERQTERHGEERSIPAVRSLGLPISRSPFSVFSLFRMPLGAFRPSDQLYVDEEDDRLAGLARVERDVSRDEWTIVELDAVGMHGAGDIRLRMVQHLLRDGARRGATRFHVACADEGGNVESFMQAGFMSYGQEHIMYRPPEDVPSPSSRTGVELGIRPAVALDALPLSRLYLTVTPAPVARLEGYRLSDWERQAGQWRIPRSCLAPILRFADVDTYVQPLAGGGSDGTQLAGFVQVGVAREDQPHYMRVLAVPDRDPGPLIEYGLGAISERSSAHWSTSFTSRTCQRRWALRTGGFLAGAHI